MSDQSWFKYLLHSQSANNNLFCEWRVSGKLTSVRKGSICYTVLHLVWHNRQQPPRDLTRGALYAAITAHYVSCNVILFGLPTEGWSSRQHSLCFLWPPALIWKHRKYASNMNTYWELAFTSPVLSHQCWLREMERRKGRKPLQTIGTHPNVEWLICNRIPLPSDQSFSQALHNIYCNMPCPEL